MNNITAKKEGEGITDKTILDACCGSRMFWFDKTNKDVLFMDIRNEEHTLCDGRSLEIKPDVIGDFRNMPFKDNSFKMVVFDPPHLKNLGDESWMAKKYGILNSTWQTDIKKGFDECFRVLQPSGTLIFKWNANQITVTEILKAIGREPLFGHKSGKQANTHWMAFLKPLPLPMEESQEGVLTEIEDKIYAALDWHDGTQYVMDILKNYKLTRNK